MNKKLKNKTKGNSRGGSLGNSRGKRGQIQMSFGMIFSIILIIAFVFTAFIVIRAFLNMQDSVNTGLFIKQLEEEIDTIWKNYGGVENKVVEIRLDKKIEYVCFYNSSRTENSSAQLNQIKSRAIYHENNLYFLPPEKVSTYSLNIKYVNMTSFSENPYCFENEKGKVTFVFNKGVRESLVRVS
jgi:competence protein ComGF